MPIRNIAVVFLCLASTVYAADAPPPIECQVRLERTEFHPGEIVRIRGYVENTGDKPVRLPAFGHTTQFFVCAPKLTTPDGRHLSYEPLAENPLRSSSSSTVRHPTELASGHERLAFDLSLRLSAGQPFWRSGEPSKPAEPSLRGTGEYRISFVLHADPRDGAPADAWTGSITSDEVAFSVRELKPGERRDEATPMQLAALEKLATLEVLDTTLLEGLQRQLLEAENEGLAAAVIDYCRQDRRWAQHLIGALAARACSPAPSHGWRGRLLVGIDGPYLKTAAELTVKALCEPTDDSNSLRLFPTMLNATLVYLRLHPEAADLRQTLISAAKRVVLQRIRRKPGAAAERDFEPEPAAPAIRLSRVGGWTVLLELEVLHAGMPVDAAVEILGPPDSRQKVPKASDREQLVWRLGSGNRVDPFLSLEAQDGKVVSVEQD